MSLNCRQIKIKKISQGFSGLTRGYVVLIKHSSSAAVILFLL